MARHLAMAAALTLAVAGAAQAEGVLPAPPQPTAAQPEVIRGAELLRDRTISHIVSRADTLKALQAEWAQLFYAGERDGAPGLGPKDSELADAMDLAAHRAQEMSRVLAYDLNGDFTIAVDELRPFAVQQANRPLRAGNAELEPSEPQKQQIIAAFIAEQMVRDADGNGQLDPAELGTPPDPALQGSSRNRGVFGFLPLLDADGDGVLTLPEHMAGLAKGITGLDANGDGLLSDAERTAFLQHLLARNQPAARARPVDPGVLLLDSLRPACALRPVPDGADVVVIAGYEGAALSTLRIGPEGTLTQVADVVVPEGQGKLMLITSLDPSIILRFSGAVDRINGLLSLDGMVATIGLQRRQLKVAGNAPAACARNFLNKAEAGKPSNEDFLTAAIGKPPLAIITGTTFGTLDLGRGTIAPLAPLPGARTLPTTGPSAPIWAEMLRLNPGGLIDIAATDVVSLSETTPYPVLPQEAGLAQLVEAGALIPQPRPEVEDMVMEELGGRVTIQGKEFFPGRGDDRIDRNGLSYTEEAPLKWIGRKPIEYVVRREITLPDAMEGSHAAIFLLPDGVPMPKGNPGHSKIRPAG
ncbi:EF-hand domain-containing protein [Rhodobacter ferrooxidans]|uniref:EF-hand domain-containing protein n=1 Tax=Rhodobacter ferrooxidans TaxID=371731 RepID=C8S1I9_9RHOB|nr:hypothetical protein [Rhodobacter sp. SW2]EEW25162.1 hypothetical protein Rsw2DRAFT_1917 [Rhodobacter sp. SW2]